MHEMKSFLDDTDACKKIDISGFIDRISHLPQQCAEAWQLGLEFQVPMEYRNVTDVVLTGVGGSAIGGELLADLVLQHGGPTIRICRDYNLPRSVGTNSLVIVSSYSGNTEETVTTFDRALEQKAKIIVVTTGGILLDRALENKIPTFTVKYVGEPRTALGFSLLVPLAILQNLGLVGPIDQEVHEAISVLTNLECRLSPDITVDHNPAKELAISMKDKLIVVYGAGILSGVARRWKTQLNENAKVWAFMELLPEAGHNAVAAFQRRWRHDKDSCVILLNAVGLDSRLRIRYNVIKEILNHTKIESHTVDGIGTGVLAQMLSSVMFGDYTSYYLALINNEDPSPVSAIDYMKSRLNGTS